MQIFKKLKILYWMVFNSIEGWHSQIWKADLDERFCCDGRDCGCGGATIEDIYMSHKPNN